MASARRKGTRRQRLDKRFGRPSSRLLFWFPIGFGVVAVVGQAIAMFAPTYEQAAIGFFEIVAINVVIGLVAGLLMDPLAAPLETGQAAANKTGAGAFWAIASIVGSCVVQIVLGLPLSIVLALSGRWDDWTVVFAPFVYVGLIGFGSALLAFLVDLLVLWPIIKLIGYVINRVTGRPRAAGVVPFSAMFLLIVLVAIFGMAVPHDGIGTTGPLKARGLALLINVWSDYSGDANEQVIAWTARGLQVLVALTIVWVVVEARSRRRSKALE